MFDFSQFPILTTERLTLREPVLADAANVFAFRGDPQVQKYNDTPLETVEDAKRLIELMSQNYANKEWIEWGITLTGTKKVIGLVGYGEWNRRHNFGSIGYDLAKAYWGQGIGSEAVGAILNFGFERMALNRIEAITLMDNERSITMLKRLGFHLDGVRRQLVLEDDGYHDSAIFSVLADEYCQANEPRS